ncbi:MAG: endonuclease VIII [Gammaproteobacteria bacterium]
MDDGARDLDHGVGACRRAKIVTVEPKWPRKAYKVALQPIFQAGQLDVRMRRKIVPEGPEVRIEADKIEAAIGGARVDDVFFGQRRLKHFADEIEGRKVESVDTRGKAMLIRFDNKLTMYSHNQLYGRWFVRPRGTLPKTNRTLRVALHSQSMSALLYSASEIAILNDEEILEHPFLSRLGPDALDESLDWRDIARRISDPQLGRRSLGAAYLDQTFIAGIGNYLRSEILFRARLQPTRKLASLARPEIERLARATVTLTRRAYKTKGVTNPAGLVKRLKKGGKKRGGYRFAIFGREGKPCYECGDTINRIAVGGRRLYLCNSCQH